MQSEPAYRRQDPCATELRKRAEIKRENAVIPDSILTKVALSNQSLF